MALIGGVNGDKCAGKCVESSNRVLIELLSQVCRDLETLQEHPSYFVSMPRF